MAQKTKTLIWIVALIALIAVAYFAYDGLTKANKPEPMIPAVTQKELISAPDFVVYAADGTEHRLSDYRGRPVVLNFWASWCPPCRNEMPHFDRVYQEVKDDVMFMMVDLVDSRQEKQIDGQRYIDGEGFIFPVFFDTDRGIPCLWHHIHPIHSVYRQGRATLSMDIAAASANQHCGTASAILPES